MGINLGFNYPQVAREAGFKIRKYDGNTKCWQIFDSIDVDQIFQEQDLHKIDKVLIHLSESSFEPILENSVFEYNILKYILVSQFAIQYLVFCRAFLEERIIDMKEAHNEAQTEIVRLQSLIAESGKEVFKLKKKIVEIEKNREVAYPCMFCSKSFINNGSLNNHIGRRHPNGADRSGFSEKCSESSTNQHDREKDLTLINTIKLQLEIKQLKERLNVAEKGMQDQNLSYLKQISPQNFAIKDTKDVGTQNNLKEQKEKDGGIDDGSGILKITATTLQQLSNKFYEFEMWRDKLRTDYDNFIKDVDKKLEYVAKSLNESSKITLKSDSIEEHESKNAMEHIEKILMQKISEIVSASTEKIEEIVTKIEGNYKLKLFELEKENKNRNLELLTVKDKHSNASIDKISSSSLNIADSDLIRKGPQNTDHEHSAISFSNETDESQYTLDRLKPYNSHNNNIACAASIGGVEARLQIAEKTNRTFHKPNNGDKIEEKEGLKKSSRKMPAECDEHKRKIVNKMEYRKMHSFDTNSRKILDPPKVYSKADAKNFANKELTKHGLNIQTKAVSSSRMKRVCIQLADRRLLLKEKYPHICEIRTEMKKFVEKLCSVELPNGTQTLLDTYSIQPEDQNAKKPKTNNVPPIIFNKSGSNSRDIEFRNIRDTLSVPRKRVMFNTPFVLKKDDIEQS